MESSLVGVDVGGTFTDLVLVGPDGKVRIAKVPTTPDNQALGVLQALAAADADPAAIATTAPRPPPTPCSSARSRAPG